MSPRARASFLLLSLLFFSRPCWAQCETWMPGPLDDGTVQNGADGPIYASMTWDPDGAGPLPERLVVGGDFASIGGVAAQNIAYYDPSLDQWLPFGAGIGAQVNALVVFNGQVVAGCSGDNNSGTFDQTVRRWNGTSWEPLSATNTGSVFVLAVHGGVLYAGGTFATNFVDQSSNPAAYLAAYDPSTDLWIAIEDAGFGTEANGAVRALASYGGALYVGGNRRSNLTVTDNAVHLAYGVLGGAWTPITSGTDTGTIHDFTVFAGELIVVGAFQTLNGTTCPDVAGWNGSTFRAFSTGVSNPSPMGSSVLAVEVFDGFVIGGDFGSAGPTSVGNVARWAPGGFEWQAVGPGTNGRVWDLTYYRDKLIAVGEFTAATAPAERIAVWDGTNWSPLGGGSAQTVNAFAAFNGRMIAGGGFQQSTFSLGAANNVASWDGRNFTPLGTGTNGPVNALEAFKYPGFTGSWEQIAGGSFTTAGGVSVQRIARWNERPNVAFPPPAWEPMGLGFNSNVNAIERASGITYAGGSFTFSGLSALSRIARWNETSDVWEPLGSGTNGTVFALKEFNGQLYAGGSFTSAGGVSTGGLARWNGSSWSQVGGFFQGTVYALEVHDGQLYIGGVFPGLPNGSNIARYNGSSYSNVGTGGTSGTVYALHSAGGSLYVGGEFSSAGGVSVDRLARWNGTQWSAARGGVGSTVLALGRFANETHVGGLFTTVDQGTMFSPRWARFNETGLPWFGVNPFSKVVSLYSDVAFSATLSGGYTGVSYQWNHDGVPLVDGPRPDGSVVSGATSEVLTLSGVVYSDQGAYRLDAITACGTVSSSAATLSFDATSVSPDGSGASGFDGIMANPTSGPTVFAFSLVRPAHVGFDIVDVRGRRVGRVPVGAMAPGQHRVQWDARDGRGEAVAAGVYFVRFELDGIPVSTRRVTVLR